MLSLVGLTSSSLDAIWPDYKHARLAASLFLYERALQVPVGQVQYVVSREEVATVSAHPEGTMWIIGVLLYGSGLRFEECLALRVRTLTSIDTR